MSEPIFIALLTGIFALFGGAGGGFIVWRLNKNDDEHKKLYGPLKFNLLMMKILVDNREDILKDIKEWKSVEVRLDLMKKHMSPLTIKWIKHRDIIRNLFEENPGLIREEDFNLAAEFIDGCIKRDIIEDGKNELALKKQRTDKLLDAVKNLQDKLL